MKLRNKKTGEIKSIEEIIRDAFLSNELDSLKNIDANWEDVEEPLIKDEKIRKAVRAWSEVNGIHNCDHLRYDRGCQSLSDIYTRNEISFNYRFEALDDGKEYTITKLCGEEEE